MRRCIAALIALVCLTGANTPNHVVEVVNGFSDVTDYRKDAEWARGRYVVGVIDGLFVSTSLGASEKATRALKACLNGVNSIQLTAIVDKYVGDHPERWQYGTQLMVFEAMDKFCPAMISR
jgi:Rap1a immunity proteins